MPNKLWRVSLARRIGTIEALIIGLVAALLAAGLRVVLRPVLQDEAAFTPNFLALFAATFLGGWLSGLTSMLVGGSLTYYFFFDPPETFVRPAPDLLSLILFWAIAGLVVLSMAQLRSALRRLAVREQELLLSREQERILAREMGHRVKNLLAVVRAIVEQSLKGSADVPDARRRIEQRLSALGTAQELALGPMKEVKLAQVLSAAIRALGDERIALEVRCDASIPPDCARGLVLALHELATNALKYGALSRPEGRVDLLAQCEGGAVIDVAWREQGGPSVAEPTRFGFGVRMIGNALNGTGGKVEMSYPPEGVVCLFRLPAAGAGVELAPRSELVATAGP